MSVGLLTGASGIIGLRMFWIWIFRDRFGNVTARPRFTSEAPSDAEVARLFGRAPDTYVGEFLDVQGPFRVTG
jgi:hypothetical protein